MMECEAHTFQYGKKKISYSLRYSKRKSVGISVLPSKEIEIIAPEGTTLTQVERVIDRKAKWILKQIDDLDKYQPVKKTKKYASGQTLRLLGRDYMIKVVQVREFEEEEIIKDHRSIKVYIRDRGQAERISLLVEDWYRNEAMVYLAQKFEECYSKIQKYGIPRPHYYLRYMQQRWGSCTPSGTIYLNPDIIQLPSHCIEYVIMHELCHLKHNDHSKEFYYFLDTLMPDWQVRSKALDSFFEL